MENEFHIFLILKTVVSHSA